jgi:cell division protease FtsH
MNLLSPSRTRARAKGRGMETPHHDEAAPEPAGGPKLPTPPKPDPGAPEPLSRRTVAALIAGWAVLIGLLVLLAVVGSASEAGDVSELSYSQFIAAVDGDRVATAVINPEGEVEGVLSDETHYATRIPTATPSDGLLDRLAEHGVAVEATEPTGDGLNWLFGLLPYLLLIGFLVWIARRGSRGPSGISGFGRSKAKLIEEQRPTTTFADVAGYEGVKAEVWEVVDYLRHPERYHEAGAVGPGGVLMVGPPGTGKTHIARAIAGEADVPFFSVTGSSFVELFVGVGASRVRDLFEQARAKAPAIVFIDEIDAIGQRRGGPSAMANDEREQTLNQLLAEMDGFDPAKGIVVLAATNRPDMLDVALLRPGRFDRQVVVPLPNQAERKAILAVHTRSKKLAPDVDLEVISRSTPGFSGADLANLANEAAIVAVRDGRVVITTADFDAARDRIILGRRDKGSVLLVDERHIVAVHEAGHAIVAALSPHADPVSKVSILPAGSALGVTQQLPVDERHLVSESYLADALAVRLGGRAAELLVLGERSSGAADDLASATGLATRMVCELGLSEELGPVSYGGGREDYLGGGRNGPREYSEATQRVIDQQVAALLRGAEERAVSLLRDRRVELDRLVDALIEREVLDGSEVYEIIGVPA